jgi:hypothetical protein
MIRLTVLYLLLLPFLFLSCGIYSTSTRTAGDVSKIAVPYLQNETAEPEIEIEITNSIIEALRKDNTLKVVAEQDADAILEGKIINYQNIPYTFSTVGDDLQADQYRLMIGLQVSLFNRKENSYIWKDKNINAHGDYFLETTGEQNYQNALIQVYEEIVDVILGATVQEW